MAPIHPYTQVKRRRAGGPARARAGRAGPGGFFQNDTRAGPPGGGALPPSARGVMVSAAVVPGQEAEEAAAEGIAHLENYGYAVLRARVPRQHALSLGAQLLALHQDPRVVLPSKGDGKQAPLYDTMFGQPHHRRSASSAWLQAFSPASLRLCMAPASECLRRLKVNAISIGLLV